MEEKLLKIINHYGINNQLRKLNEEVFELEEAIINGELLDLDDETVNHITEEIADCMVILSQFKEYYDIDGRGILRIMNEKIERQLGRIENENNRFIK